MSCPKLKIPWPRVIGEPTPSVDHDQENWKAVERWADGILKCIPEASISDGAWVHGTSTDAVSISAGGSSAAWVIDFTDEYLMDTGYDLQTSTGNWVGIQVPRDGAYLADFNVDFTAQVAAPVLGDMVGQLTIYNAYSATLGDTRASQWTRTSLPLMVTSTTGGNIEGYLQVTNILHLRAGYFFCPVYTINAIVAMTDVDFPDAAARIRYLGPTNDTFFPCA